jgi:glycine/D-amino acid oxidase-like deaminating enzyme/nitrite reductase/ring-hydroxylating ferredoxin subunit
MPNYSNTPWMESVEARRFPRLEGDVTVDVAVIGGGVTGVTAALLLKRAGQRVALIESRRIGKGETGRTTAHLTEVLDTRYASLISRFGRDEARLAAESQRAAIDRIASFVSELGIDCGFGFVPGFLYAEDEEGAEGIAAEERALAILGIDARPVSALPLPLPVRRALRFERQAQMHPRAYLAALALQIPGDGSQLFEETHVRAVDDGEPCRVITERGVVIARQVIVAAHVPVSNRLFIHNKLAPYRSYVVAVPTSLPADLGLFWDSANPYHYIRTQGMGGHTFLIVGGEDHRVGEEDDTTQALARLERYVGDRLGVEVGPTDYRWSGQIVESADGLPYIGRSAASHNVYVATGFGGNGITGGTMAAMLLAGELTGTRSPWADLFDATRWKPLASARAVLTESGGYARHMVGDRLSKQGPEAVAHLSRGEGTVITIEGERYAVYRNGEGHLSALSPVCTHLGCLVRWNSAETSWDCPCHGSRYDPHGRVLNGPAMEALPPKQLPESEETDEEDAGERGTLIDLGEGVPA